MSATPKEMQPTLATAQLCSGLGQFHTNEPDPAKPHKILRPYETVTFQQVQQMVDAPPSVPKAQGQWLIPSTLLSRTFETQRLNGRFYLLWADIDTGCPHDVLARAVEQVAPGADYEIYSSRSATEDFRKWRVLIPIEQPLSGDDYASAQMLLEEKLVAAGIPQPDETARRNGQLCFLPNRGAFYHAVSKRDGCYHSPLTTWADELRELREADQRKRDDAAAKQQAVAERRAARAGNGDDLIGAFNNAHPVETILLGAGYAEHPRGGHFRHPKSESGSFSASVKDGRVYTLSSSDPLYTADDSNGAHDAFSAFTVLFHGGDQKAALIDAGDHWLTIDGLPWNTVKQREFAQRESQGDVTDNVSIDIKPTQSENDGTEDAAPVCLGDFYAHMPDHRYIFTPTRELWPASSVDSRLPLVPVAPKVKIKASRWLDRHQPVEQLTWAPGEAMLIKGRLLADGGWIRRKGLTGFNLYREPTIGRSNPADADKWIEHVHRVYPNEADHIIKWLAHRVQRPGEKINHAIVMGGSQGIGKDTILEPVKAAVGPWNFSEVSPGALLGRFNGFVKSVVLRVSEARDLGDIDRFAFYDHMKTYTAAPPDVLRCDEKNIREYSVLNVCGVVITTNHKTDGIYLPADDRRHYVAWSDADKDDYSQAYWDAMYDYFERGGNEAVNAYLLDLDLSGFNAKAPPPKTDAFWHIVDAARSPEETDLAGVLEELGNPDAVTLTQISARAGELSELTAFIRDRKSRRQVPHQMERAGYEPVRNEAAKDGHWNVYGRRQAIYARRELNKRDKLTAAGKLARGGL